MSLVLNTNLNSLVAQNSLSSSGMQLTKALTQLSSGLRINTAADDAAGYAISLGMTSQINGMNIAARNAADGVSMMQTASGALSEIVSDLQSMRDLAVQSLNATNSTSDRTNLNTQYAQLLADIGTVSSSSKFNNVALLDGTFTNVAFQIGANSGDSITVAALGNATTGATGLAVATTGVDTTVKATAALTAIDTALQTVAGIGATLGAYQNRFQAAITGLNTTATNLSAARSQIQDTNYAQATSDLSKAQILQQASTAMVAQANTVPQNVLSLLQKLP